MTRLDDRTPTSTAGEVGEDVHTMTAWTPRTREVAIEASSFALESVYDGGEDDRPHVDPGSVGGLLWHVLAKRGG